MKAQYYFPLFIRFYRVIVFILAYWGMAVDGYGQPVTFSKPNPKAEAWVEKQISQNNKANLLGLFSDEEAVLSASFLEKILLSDSKNDSLHPRVIQIRHATIAGNVDLRNVEFAQGVSLTECKFEGSVLFSQSHFSSIVILDDSSFFQDVDFSEIRADSGVEFRRTMFEKSLNMTGALIQGDLTASKARFLDVEQGINFTGLEISQTAYLNQAVFEGPVRCYGLTLGGQIQANGTHFLDAKIGALFPRLYVVGLASFDGAFFEGPADFTGAEIHGQFQAGEARFNHPQSPLVLSNVKVDENLLFPKAVFGGPVRFCGMDVRGSLNLNGAAFKNPVALVDFSSASVRDAFFENCSFDGLFQLDSLNYQTIHAGDEKNGFKKLLALIETAQYSLDTYNGLEDYFLKRGETQAADRVFIARKERERRERIPRYSFAWFANAFLGQVCCHGRQPERILLIGTAIILFGALFVFRPNRMKPVDPYGKPFRNSFWYSLELFLPLIDLRTAKYYTPMPQCNWIRNYQRVHILLGWILIPLFLASVLGWIQ